MNDQLTTHTCHAGPLCAYWWSDHNRPEDDPGGCDHYSCMEIVHEFCDACQCEALDDDAVTCPEHGLTTITATYVYTGHAGGCCWAVQAECGCFITDESADVRAAR
jgi:hypothetical protein